MKIVAITGGFSTGKTTVANIFEELGAEVIDSDKLAHDIYSPNKPAWNKIVKYFGKSILCKNKKIDRSKLADIVFKNKENIKKLNSIVHPYVEKELKSIINKYKKNKKNKILIIEVPLLFEAGMREMFDKIIVVSCGAEEQYMRIKKKYKKNDKEISQRIKSQWDLSKKEGLADYIIDNNGTKRDTKRQIIRIFNSL